MPPRESINFITNSRSPFFLTPESNFVSETRILTAPKSYEVVNSNERSSKGQTETEPTYWEQKENYRS